MRQVVVALVAAVVVGLAGPGWPEDIYRWQDTSGRVVYSNSASGEGATRVPAPEIPVIGTPGPSPEAADEDAGTAAPTGTGDGGARAARPRSEAELEGLSTSASLRRNQLERDLRATESRIRTLDARLKTLASARTRYTNGLAATGGVRTAAVDLRSEEETTLGAEREQLAQHAVEVRGEAAKLKAEVTQALGAPPAWWADLR